MKIKCNSCGKEREISLSLEKKSGIYFCNKICFHSFYNEKRKCIICNTEYECRKKSTQKTCSNKCKMSSVRERALQSQKKNYSSERRSEVLKKMWAERREEILKKRNTDEYRKRVSQHSIEKFKDERVRKNHSESIKKTWTDERIKKHREITLNRINKNNSKIITKPNLIVGSLLGRLDIKFEYEQPIKDICRPDIKLDENNYIEVFGDYWHCNPDIYDRSATSSQNGNKERDLIKRERLRKERPEIKILTLWETDVYFNLKEVERRIREFVEGREEKYPVLRFEDFRTEKIDRERAGFFLSMYHYLHSVPLICNCFHGLFYKNSLIGVSVWGNPTARNKEEKKRLELYRFCLVDGLPKNSASYFLSRSIKMLKEEYKEVEELISYADTGYHTGTIYKATNWEEVGEVEGSYYYVNESGVELDRRKIAAHCSALMIKESEYVEKLGLRKIKENRKKKYIYKMKRD